MSDPLLSFRCRFQYPGGFGLDAAFELPGGISALFGPSGGGKSTCLALIAGLLKPAAGAIHLRDTVLCDRAARRWVAPHRRGLGLVFQDHLLFPHRTVRANLRYGVCRGPAPAPRMDQIVELLELDQLLDRYPDRLSGGQQRRVALARALLTQPRLLMMDEPLTGLDDALRDRILDHLQQVHEQWRLPMLLVSHDQTAVRRLARHAVVIEAGRVVDQGPTGPTLDRATLRTMTSHPGPINLLRVEQARQTGDHGEGRVGDQMIFLTGPVTGATMYVRCLPREVALVLEDVPRISMRNHLRGIVRDVVSVRDAIRGERVYVALDVGQTLWVELTPAACREMDLRPGRPAIGLIKATALEPVS